MKLMMAFFLYLVFTAFNVQADTTVCVVGDTGTGKKEQYAVSQAMHKAGCEKILITGDIIYPDGAYSADDEQWITKFEQPYHDLITQNNALFYISLGNHDHRAGRTSRVEKIYQSYGQLNPHFYFPSRYYAFHSTDSWSGSACFWAIDTDSFDEDQAQAVELSMQTNTSCRWKVVFGHHPIVSSGRHGDASWFLASVLQPMLERNADVYFAGHDHNLADEGYVTSRSGERGFRQIVSGAGGKLRGVSSCEYTGCNFVRSTLGFVKATFSATHIKMDFIDTNNTVIYTTEMQ